MKIEEAVNDIVYVKNNIPFAVMERKVNKLIKKVVEADRKQIVKLLNDIPDMHLHETFFNSLPMPEIDL